MAIYLYVKQCCHCNLKYFGKTEQKDPYRYKGSGKRWKNHLKFHNSESETLQLWSFENKDEATNFALRFSKEHNIVESDEWANLKPENGIDGGDTSSFIDYSKSYRGKGSTYEERYGLEKAQELKDKRKSTLGKTSSSRKGKTLVELYGEEKAKEIISKNSSAHKTSRGPHSEQRKEKIRQSALGRKLPKVECSECGKSISVNNIGNHMKTHEAANSPSI